MKLICSYYDPWPNWYVGKFYNFFFNYLQEKKYDVTFIPLEEFAQRYNLPTNYNNNLPSIMNFYNLIIQNPSNDKTFIHSWNDHAPAMLEDGSGVENLNLVLFSCVSHLTKENFNNFSKKYKIQPSFYLLENWNDIDLIQKYKNTEKKYKKAFFNGGHYSGREPIINILKQHEYFNIKAKHVSADYLLKDDYYLKLSEHYAGLSLNGAAVICYRDLECAGLNTLLIREDINIMMNNPLIKNVHYISLVDEQFKSLMNINVEECLKYTSDIIYSISDSTANDIINNARAWYDLNCTPKEQARQLLSFLKELSIFE